MNVKTAASFLCRSLLESVDEELMQRYDNFVTSQLFLLRCFNIVFSMEMIMSG